jgi:hypothetical protein
MLAVTLTTVPLHDFEGKPVLFVFGLQLRRLM